MDIATGAPGNLRYEERQEWFEKYVFSYDALQTASHPDDATCTLQMRSPVTVRRLLHLQRERKMRVWHARNLCSGYLPWSTADKLHTLERSRLFVCLNRLFTSWIARILNSKSLYLSGPLRQFA
jgi:hypothetical protein